MKNHEMKIYFNEKLDTTHSNAQVLKLIEAKLQNPLSGDRIEVCLQSSVKSLMDRLTETYECTVRESISGGCYGARDGSISKGLTVWMHPKHLVDRYVDKEFGEMVNPYHLLEEHGKLIEGLDGEDFEKIAEELDLEIKADNTYNFNSNSSEDAGFIFDFQFSTVELPKGGLIASIMFHCGGDPRGNYTEKFVYKLNYSDDFYSVIFPSKYLTDEESENEK